MTLIDDICIQENESACKQNLRLVMTALRYNGHHHDISSNCHLMQYKHSLYTHDRRHFCYRVCHPTTLAPLSWYPLILCLVSPTPDRTPESRPLPSVTLVRIVEFYAHLTLFFHGKPCSLNTVYAPDRISMSTQLKSSPADVWQMWLVFIISTFRNQPFCIICFQCIA